MRYPTLSYYFNRLTSRLLPAWWFLAVRFLIIHGHWPSLHAPRTLAEKMFCCLIFDRNLLRPVFADKLAARSYIADKGYGEHLPKMLGTYSHVDEIAFDLLPERYVVKATHGSGFVRIVTPEHPLDKATLRKESAYWLAHDYYFFRREWFYRRLPRRLMIEEFIGDISSPTDYKIFIANGNALFIQVDEDRFGDYRRTFYATDWQRLPFSHPRRTADYDLPKPAPLAAMLAAAKTLVGGVQFARVDFYVQGERFYVGEITNVPGAAGAPIRPREWCLKMGEAFGPCPTA